LRRDFSALKIGAVDGFAALRFFVVICIPLSGYRLCARDKIVVSHCDNHQCCDG
jgi:hypothetical protein